MGRKAALVASLLALGACAGPRWQKPGVDAAQASADFSECNSMAQQAVRRDSDIDADILASRGQDWQNSGTLSTHKASIAADTGQRSDDVLSACMASKGYGRAP